jgi:hypothetical protein
MVAQPDAHARRVVMAQWLVVLGPPVIWALRFGLSYALMPLACSADAVLLLHAMNAVAMLLLAGLGWLAYRFWRGSGETGADDAADRIRRTRFMGLFGMMSAALFLLVIGAESLANVMIEPCMTAGPLVPH